MCESFKMKRPSINRLLLPAIILFFLIDADVFSRTRVAILDFTAENTTQSSANAVRNLFEAALYGENAADILERNQMETILKEQGFSLSGCVDSSCAVQIGKLLSADMVVTGSLNRLGKYVINAKFVNVASGSVNFMETAETAEEHELKDQVYSMARKAARKMGSKTGGAPLFDFHKIAGNVKGGIQAFGAYAVPISATDTFIDPSVGAGFQLDLECLSSGSFQLLIFAGGDYIAQRNEDPSVDLERVSLYGGWVGPSVRVMLPWSFAIQANIGGGYARTVRLSERESVSSNDPLLLGDLEMKYYLYGPLFIAMHTAYLRVFYAGVDLSEMLYGAGVGYSL